MEPMAAEGGSAPEDLYARVFRATLWPLLDRANGTQIQRRLAFLEASQWWDRERLEALQRRKLRRLLEHAAARVPFWRRTFAERGLTPADLREPADLRRLPCVGKPALKADPRDFLAEGERLETLIAGTTSGSTGQPTRFHRSRQQESWHWALKYRMWGMAGYRLGVPYANLYNMRRASWRKRLQDRLLRNRAFYVFGAGDQSAELDRVLAALRDPRLAYLAGCTTTLKLLAEHLARRGGARPPGLRALLTTGSLLSARDRELLERGLGAPVWDHYGLGGEGAHVAAECEHKRGYHVNVENLIVEPADPASVDTGEASEVIVTVLDNLAWPLIRYATGDFAVFTRRACECGRGLPLLERIDGRVSELLRLPNGAALNVHYFSVVLGKHDGVLQYQVEQVRPDRLRIAVVWGPDAPVAASQAAIARELSAVSHGSVEVEFASLAEIPLLPNGKQRYVIPLAQAPR
jgi:phenylacetate-CoA ligase